MILISSNGQAGVGLEEVRIADLCFSCSVVAAIAEDPIDHDEDQMIFGMMIIGKQTFKKSNKIKFKLCKTAQIVTKATQKINF